MGTIGYDYAKNGSSALVGMDMACLGLRRDDCNDGLRRRRGHGRSCGRNPNCRCLRRVYHAEVVAHRVGEPFGTLMLALAVTIIEVALIVSVMVGVSGNKAGLAQDTVFAVVMIVSNVSSASVCYRVECGIESRDFKCKERPPH